MKWEVRVWSPWRGRWIMFGALKTFSTGEWARCYAALRNTEGGYTFRAFPVS